MKSFYLLFSLLIIIEYCGAPPVSQQQKKEEHEGDSEINGLEDYMEYHRYLKEVVNALESDPEFRLKLEKADENDIKSGKIAEELEFVSHHVRTRLDEIKRVELDRLKQQALELKKLEDPNSINDDPVHHHVDHANPHTFEIEDLKKLIAKTTADLAEIDRKRKDEFKQYELEKEYKKQEKLNHTTGDERLKLEKEYKEQEEKHKKHEKLHEPGHKAQLEEVWEEQDQMQQDFDPKTFFMLHDVDGNGLWDQDEVKALFVKELDKMYQAGAPEDDMRERVEEMERMRESVFREMDQNQDGFIDFHEFVRQTNTNEFKQDHGWQALDEQKPYTDQELEEYIRHHEAMNQQQYGGYQQGYPVPPNGYQHVPPGGYQQHIPQGGYQQQQGGYQQQQGGYQQQQGGYQQQHVPQGGYQQVPQVNYQQGYPQQPPQGYQAQPVGVSHPQQHQPQQQGVPQYQQGVPQQQGNPQQQVVSPQQQGVLQQPQGVPQQPQGAPQQPQGVPQQPQGVPQQNQQEIPQHQGVHQNNLNTNEINPPPQVHQKVHPVPPQANQI